MHDLYEARTLLSTALASFNTIYSRPGQPPLRSMGDLTPQKLGLLFHLLFSTVRPRVSENS
jgi:hypothetical protein